MLSDFPMLVKYRSRRNTNSGAVICKFVRPRNTRMKMYAVRVACCPLVSHAECASDSELYHGGCIFVKSRSTSEIPMELNNYSMSSLGMKPPAPMSFSLSPWSRDALLASRCSAGRLCSSRVCIPIPPTITTSLETPTKYKHRSLKQHSTVYYFRQ